EQRSTYLENLDISLRPHALRLFGLYPEAHFSLPRASWEPSFPIASGPVPPTVSLPGLLPTLNLVQLDEPREPDLSYPDDAFCGTSDMQISEESGNVPLTNLHGPQLIHVTTGYLIDSDESSPSMPSAMSQDTQPTTAQLMTRASCGTPVAAMPECSPNLCVSPEQQKAARDRHLYLTDPRYGKPTLSRELEDYLAKLEYLPDRMLRYIRFARPETLRDLVSLPSPPALCQVPDTYLAPSVAQYHSGDQYMLRHLPDNSFLPNPMPDPYLSPRQDGSPHLTTINALLEGVRNGRCQTYFFASMTTECGSLTAVQHTFDTFQQVQEHDWLLTNRHIDINPAVVRARATYPFSVPKFIRDTLSDLRDQRRHFLVDVKECEELTGLVCEHRTYSSPQALRADNWAILDGQDSLLLTFLVPYGEDQLPSVLSQPRDDDDDPDAPGAGMLCIPMATSPVQESTTEALITIQPPTTHESAIAQAIAALGNEADEEGDGDTINEVDSSRSSDSRSAGDLSDFIVDDDATLVVDASSDTESTALFTDEEDSVPLSLSTAMPKPCCPVDIPLITDPVLLTRVLRELVGFNFPVCCEDQDEAPPLYHEKELTRHVSPPSELEELLTKLNADSRQEKLQSLHDDIHINPTVDVYTMFELPAPAYPSSLPSLEPLTPPPFPFLTLPQGLVPPPYPASLPSPLPSCHTSLLTIERSELVKEVIYSASRLHDLCQAETQALTAMVHKEATQQLDTSHRMNRLFSETKDPHCRSLILDALKCIRTNSYAAHGATRTDDEFFQGTTQYERPGGPYLAKRVEQHLEILRETSHLDGLLHELIDKLGITQEFERRLRELVSNVSGWFNYPTTTIDRYYANNPFLTPSQRQQFFLTVEVLREQELAHASFAVRQICDYDPPHSRRLVEVLHTEEPRVALSAEWNTGDTEHDDNEDSPPTSDEFCEDERESSLS
ncbi:hypothetical protein FISHEDRAFT_78613, partial [Fistulina hepatica ATCC 64428]